MFLEKVLGKAEGGRCLVAGIGGGGDILATVPTANLLKHAGWEVFFGTVPWERFVVDSEPGPRPLKEMENIYPLSETVALAGKKTKSRKGVVFQAARFAEATGEKVLLLDLTLGVEGLCTGLKEALKKLGVNLVFGIDSGGDVLAKGSEKGLRSPLADAMMLSALAQLGGSPVIGVFGFGSDGELSGGQILSRLSEVARAGGYLGAWGMTAEDVKLMEKISQMVFTEASNIPLMAARGFRGLTRIREGTRKVHVSILSTLTFYLDAKTLFSLSPLAQRIQGSKSLWEANEALHRRGVFTELDFEAEIRRLNITSYKEWEKTRRKSRLPIRVSPKSSLGKPAGGRAKPTG